MTSSGLTISRIPAESDLVLRNLFEYYVHDMGEWFAVETKADGSYSYDTSAVWKAGCDAYLATVGDSIAGFAIVGSAAAWLGDSGAHEIREFFILRRFRRCGWGGKLAGIVWNQRPGAWLVRVLAANSPALAFWRAAIDEHSQGQYEEEERIVNGQSWRFFRFVCGGDRAND